MEYTAKALADLSGVSPRTLRCYDRFGLLKPLRTTRSDYRIYGPAQVDRLQQILFYREVGFSLADIGRVLDTPDSGPGGAAESPVRPGGQAPAVGCSI